MSFRDITDPNAVYRAVAEFDTLGQDAFLTKYGFREAREYGLLIDGKHYDSKAILGAAHGFQFPEAGPLKASDFSGGEATVAKKLRTMGFVVPKGDTGADMSPLVLVQNDTTTDGKYDHWEDLTGTRYHFPNVYKNRMIEGRPFVYYRGVHLVGGRRRAAPEYFGCGKIGPVSKDPSVPAGAPKTQWKWYAELVDYVPFQNPLNWTRANGTRYEELAANLYQIGIREIAPETYSEILRSAGVSHLLAAAVEPAPLSMPALSDVVAIVLGDDTQLLVSRVPSNAADGVRGDSTARRSPYANAIGKRAEEIVFRRLQTTLTPDESRTLRWLSSERETPGWDMQFMSKSGGLERIEVKGTSAKKFVNVEVTAREWEAAREHRGGYWLYLVAQCTGREPLIQRICDPYMLYEDQRMTAIPVVWRLEMNGSQE